MKTLSLKLNNFPKDLEKQLQTVFMYIVNTQIKQNNIEPITLSLYPVMQGRVLMECKSAYDEIRVEQIVNNALRIINLFSSDNNDFEGFNEAELAQLDVLLNAKLDDKLRMNYMKAIKTLRKAKYFPPLSMQRNLVSEASTFIEENELGQETTTSTTIAPEHKFKQGDLQISSWIWTRIVEKVPNNPFKKEATQLATTLHGLGIKGVEELQLLTSNYYRYIMYIGDQNFARLATAEEVRNKANIKNIFGERVEIYRSQLDKYLTACCSALFTRNIGAVNIMYEILNSPTCTISYDLRFPNLKELTTVKEKNISFQLAEERWIKIILANRDVIANILTSINTNASHLFIGWKNSKEDFAYPENLDCLQIYYENRDVDFDELDALMSIEAEEGDITHMLETIKKAGVHSPYDKLPYDIACKALKTKSSLSEKQLNVIEKRYASIMKTAEMAKTIDAEECVQIATELTTKFGDKLHKTVKQIAESTLRYRICSERQLEVLRMALVQMNAATEKATQGPTAGMGQMSFAGQVTEQTNTPGMMFELPTQGQTAERQTAHGHMLSQAPKVDEELINKTKNNLMTDAYKNAFSGQTSGNNSADTDSIWTD